MFKVFNRYLTSRTSGHDQTKSNILHIFHVVVNKFESVPKRLEEEYHSIKDDTSLVSAYTIGKVTIKGMLIPPDLITVEIRANRTPRSTRTPNSVNDVVQKKKGKQADGETNIIEQMVKIRQNGQSIYDYGRIYIQYETEKALINNQVYNWKTAKYSKIWYIKDINYLRLFETKFPAIVYNDALKSESEFSAEPTLSSHHVNKVNWKNETSLPECDYEEYNFISERKALKKRFSKKEKFNILNIEKDLFCYEISSDNNLQIDKGNDDDKTGYRYGVSNLMDTAY
ncbi:hypothetical protein Tco_0935997 [Tanacetum coccineum]